MNPQSEHINTNTFKIKVAKHDIIEALRCQQSVIDKKAIRPIFSHVKLTAQDDKLSVEGHDGTMVLIYELDCTVEKSGIITVPAQLLYNLVRKANGEFVLFELNDDIVEVKYGSGIFKLNTLEHSTLPNIPTIKEDACIFESKFFDLLQYFKMVKIGMLNDEIKTCFNGIYIETKNEAINFVSTDAHRLAMYKTNIKIISEFNLIISKKTVETLCNIITTNDEIKCYKEDNQIKFKAKNFTLISRLISGTFPDYTSIIPKTVEGILESDVSELKNCLERISILSSQISKIVYVELQEKAKITSNNVAYGSGEEILPGHYQGTNVTFGIDCNIWMDFLRLFDSGLVRIAYHGNSKPIVMQHTDFMQFTYIAMPITV
ncbi:MAG: DNA polymerase III subunit beta [Alphaproteobacteria bacterium]|nr:MAG: DNA polymerase III subunit beta [Alphaproteobacteria bacterium]